MAGENDPTTKFRRERSISKVIDELIAEGEFDEGPATQKEVRVLCKYCETMVLKKPSMAGYLDRHDGPCGLPCLGGGVSVGVKFHCDRCLACRFPGRFPEGTKVP